jgi:hypothetical protein
MAIDFKISVDFSDLLAASPIAKGLVFENLSRQVELTAAAGAERWKQAVFSAPLWDGERRAYAATISYRMIGPYAAEISSNYKFSEDIESGRPPYDLKQMLNTSMKVRVSKKGKRYLIIPFRHNTPGNAAHAPAMPSEVYESARELSFSKITGTGKRASGTGAFDIKTRAKFMVASRKYHWGGRLAAEPEYKLKPQHHSDPYSGMVRFKEKTGGSKYLTFRVMVEGSPGWIVPAKPGLWLAKNVAESLERGAAGDFGAAIAKDLA